MSLPTRASLRANYPSSFTLQFVGQPSTLYKYILRTFDLADTSSILTSGQTTTDSNGQGNVQLDPSLLACIRRRTYYPDRVLVEIAHDPQTAYAQVVAVTYDGNIPTLDQLGSCHMRHSDGIDIGDYALFVVVLVVLCYIAFIMMLR